MGNATKYDHFVKKRKEKNRESRVKTEVDILHKAEEILGNYLLMVSTML